jgi:hypothetical protein
MVIKMRNNSIYVPRIGGGFIATVIEPPEAGAWPCRIVREGGVGQSILRWNEFQVDIDGRVAAYKRRVER